MKKLNVKGAVMKSGAVGAGAIAAASLNKIGFIKSIKQVAARGAVKIALGAFGPGFLGKGKKAEMLENVGNGMIAVGALEVYNGIIAKTDANKALVISGVPTLGEAPARVYIDESYGGVGSASDTLGSTASSQPSYQY